MNDHLTELAFVLDRSGSMHPVAESAIAGFNDFLREQQSAKGQARLTLVLFDNEYLVPTCSIPVQECIPLDPSTYSPRGSTALLDAIGRTILGLGERLAVLPESQRPAQVIVAILTDGQENASCEFTWAQIAARIKHQTEVYSWKFLFLGANQDAIATAAKLHIAPEDSTTFHADGIGVAASSSVVSRKTAGLRARKLNSASPQEIHDSEASLEVLLREEDRKRRCQE